MTYRIRSFLVACTTLAALACGNETGEPPAQVTDLGASDSVASETTATDTASALDAAAAEPDAQGPDGQAGAPDTESPDAPDAQAGAPDTEGPDTADAQAGAPDTEGPDTADAQAGAPDTEGPDAPDSQAGAPDAADPGDVPSVDAAEPAVDAQPADSAPACVPTNPPQEACDGVDNDCNGVTDEGAQLCTSGNPCVSVACAVCDSPNCGSDLGKKACVATPANEGGSCEDGNACSATSACSQGACAGNVACDDGLACTIDACDPKTGCSHSADVGKCADGNACTDDVCDLAQGCTHTANVAACDDGDACTTGSACKDGTCAGNQVKACDDGKVCTDDTCDKTKGCLATPNTAACADGDACTIGDTCGGGACKAGGPACDDKDVCTADACTQGTCKHTPLANCKACLAATDCDDKNPCTTDACTQASCVWTPVAGCIPPTNYTAKALAFGTAPLAIGGVATFTATAVNLGKAHAGTFSTKMKWQIWFSVDGQIDDKDVKLYEKPWDGYNIGKDKGVIEGTDKVTLQLSAPVGFQHQHACLRLVYATDGSATDNDVCAPVQVLGGEPGLVGFGPASKLTVTSATEGGSSTLVLQTKNPGTASVQPVMEVFLSADGTLDASDVKLIPPVQAPVFPVGTQEVTWTFGHEAFQSIASGTIGVCVRANGATAAQETVPTDNVYCGQVAVQNPVDFVVDTSGLGAGGPLVATGSGVVNGASIAWGSTIGCTMNKLLNAGTGKADKPFAARCAIAQATTPTAVFAAPLWQLAWTVTDPIAAAGPGCLNCYAKATLAAPTPAKLVTPGLGSYYLCFEANHDNALLETKKANSAGCRQVSVVGPDLTLSTQDCKLPNAELKAATTYTFRFIFQNSGTTALGGTKGVHLGQLLLSKDGSPSADDVVLWQRVEDSWTSYSGKYSMSAPGQPMDIPYQVPAGTAVGDYHLLIVVNADNKLVEPPGNNVLAKAVKVVP